MTSGFAADVTSSLAVVKSKSSKERGRTSSCDLSARQMVVSPARKTGLVRMKSRTRPMAGAAEFKETNWQTTAEHRSVSGCVLPCELAQLVDPKGVKITSRVGHFELVSEPPIRLPLLTLLMGGALFLDCK